MQSVSYWFIAPEEQKIIIKILITLDVLVISGINS